MSKTPTEYIIERRATCLNDDVQTSTYHGFGDGDAPIPNLFLAKQLLHSAYRANLIRVRRSCVVTSYEEETTGFSYQTGCEVAEVFVIRYILHELARIVKRED